MVVVLLLINTLANARFVRRLCFKCDLSSSAECDSSPLLFPLPSLSPLLIPFPFPLPVPLLLLISVLFHNFLQMHRFLFRPFHLFLLLLSVLFFLKIRRVVHIQSFLAEQSVPLQKQQMAQYVEAFKKAIATVGNDSAPAIVLLNKFWFALNITLNFVCNLRLFPGASERLIAVVFDQNSEMILRNSFPNLNVIHWPLLALADKFGSGDGRYQLFQYFRAKLAAFLTELVPSFWMVRTGKKCHGKVQADTIWRKNLFEIIDVENGTDGFGEADLVFDSEGADGLLSSMIAGGYFFVRSSDRSRNFFESVSHFLLNHFATDNNVMARQCLLGMHGTKCAQIPYRVLSNWRQTNEENEMAENGGPALFQFDGGDSAGDKFEKMKADGHLFVDLNSIGGWNYMEEGKGDNYDGRTAKCAESRRESEDGRGTEGKDQSRRAAEKEEEKSRNRTEKSRNWTMVAIHALFEWAHELCPGIKRFLIAELFPHYAAHFFV